MANAQSAVHFSLFATTIGDCGIAWQRDVVAATHLPEQTSKATAARLAARAGATENKPPAFIEHAIASICALLEGERTDLTDIHCDFSRVDAFSVGVYDAARAIPPGETLTYGDIAVHLGDKQLARSVGRALGRNPFPIIVPCHRVIGADGRLTGFSAYGGVDTKLKMLAIERARMGREPGLFDDLPLTDTTQ